jgi:xanthine dehydrogenase YagT iron-sulfur-binding subunit
MSPDQRKPLASSRRWFLGQALTAAGTAIAAPKLFNTVEARETLQNAPDRSSPIQGETQVTLTINGQPHTVTIEPCVTLLDVLRERLGLTGTKKGCDHGQCGACTVLVEGERVYSCLCLAIMQEGKQIVTIEGLARGEQLHPVQAAFMENDGFQCGYCTPGQICASVALINEVQRGCASVVTPDLTRPPKLAEISEAEIRERLSGNLCRCSAYNGIVAAIQQAAGQIPPPPDAKLQIWEATEVRT